MFTYIGPLELQNALVLPLYGYCLAHQRPHDQYLVRMRTAGSVFLLILERFVNDDRNLGVALARISEAVVCSVGVPLPGVTFDL